MVLGLLGMSWVMAGTNISELLAWESISSQKKKLIRIISLTIFWVIWKEHNNRAFEGEKVDFNTIKDNWFHYFDSTILGHNLDCMDDFGYIVDMLIAI